METALFISRNDLVKNTIINGNTDSDLFMNFIKLAQEIHVQNYIGTRLYNRISNEILSNTLSGQYLTLVEKYLQPILIHYAMVEYLPFAAYQVKNGGIVKHVSENSETPSKNEVDYLVGKQRDLAEYYVTRFIDYICSNSVLFPEYNNNLNEDVSPDKDINPTGWVL